MANDSTIVWAFLFVCGGSGEGECFVFLFFFIFFFGQDFQPMSYEKVLQMYACIFTDMWWIWGRVGTIQIMNCRTI